MTDSSPSALTAAAPTAPAASKATFTPLWPGWPPAALRAMWAEQRAGRPPLALLIASAGCGVGAAVLVVGHETGLGLAAAALAGWLVAAHELRRRARYGDLAITAVCPPLLTVPALRDAGWLSAVCLLAAAAVLVIAVAGARSARNLPLAGVAFGGTLLQVAPWLGRGAVQRAGGRREQVIGALRSLAVTAAVLIVFGALFASADRVFASYLPRPDLGLLPGRAVVFAVAAAIAGALWQVAARPPRWAPRDVPRRTARLGEWLLPIVSLDALVTAFVLVQVGALVGGDQHVRRTAGLTYAQYTREGFAQLVAATIATFVVFAVATRRAPRTTARERALVRAGLALLCLATLGVVASALRRMDLYVDAFGLTRLRLLATTGEVAMGALLVLALLVCLVPGRLLPGRLLPGWGGRLGAASLPRAVVLVGAVALLCLAAINPDAQIARHNTAASLATEVDVDYLQGLSADAAPTFAGLPEPWRTRVLLGTSWGQPFALSRPDGGALDRFASWNLGRSRAVSLLAR